MSESTPGDETKLDEALEETFPASDAPSNTVETGIILGDVNPSQPPAIEDNTALHRFELTVDDHTAFLLYQRTGDALTLIHTEVPVAVRGRQIGETLVEAVLRRARAEGLSIIPTCPFVLAYMRRHPQS